MIVQLMHLHQLQHWQMSIQVWMLMIDWLTDTIISATKLPNLNPGKNANDWSTEAFTSATMLPNVNAGMNANEWLINWHKKTNCIISKCQSRYQNKWMIDQLTHLHQLQCCQMSIQVWMLMHDWSTDTNKLTASFPNINPGIDDNEWLVKWHSYINCNIAKCQPKVWKQKTYWPSDAFNSIAMLSNFIARFDVNYWPTNWSIYINCNIAQLQLNFNQMAE